MYSVSGRDALLQAGCLESGTIESPAMRLRYCWRLSAISRVGIIGKVGNISNRIPTERDSSDAHDEVVMSFDHNGNSETHWRDVTNDKERVEW